MAELAERVLAAIDETERIAREADPHVYPHGRLWLVNGVDVTKWLWEAEAAHIGRQDPHATLRRCAADRKILALHVDEPDDPGWCSTCTTVTEHETSLAERSPCPTVLALAEAYGIITEETR